MYEILTKRALSFMYKMIQEIISMLRANSDYPIILDSISGFLRIKSLELKPKPTADIEYVHSRHVQSMHNVCSWHVLQVHTHTCTHTHAHKPATYYLRTTTKNRHTPKLLMDVKKIDKDQFLSISPILSIIDKNFNLLIVIVFQRLFKNSPFSEKTVKNCFGGTFDNFLGKGRILRQKLT